MSTLHHEALYETCFDESYDEFMKSNNFIPLYFQHLSRNKRGELVEYDVVFEKINL